MATNLPQCCCSETCGPAKKIAVNDISCITTWEGTGETTETETFVFKRHSDNIIITIVSRWFTSSLPNPWHSPPILLDGGQLIKPTIRRPNTLPPPNWPVSEALMSCTSGGTNIGGTDPQRLNLQAISKLGWHIKGFDTLQAATESKWSLCNDFETPSLIPTHVGCKCNRSRTPLLQCTISPTGRCLRCDAHTFQNFMEPLLEIRTCRIDSNSTRAYH